MAQPHSHQMGSILGTTGDGGSTLDATQTANSGSILDTTNADNDNGGSIILGITPDSNKNGSILGAAQTANSGVNRYNKCR